MALESVVRKRVRSSSKLLDLDYIESTESILKEQRKLSEALFEEGDLFL